MGKGSYVLPSCWSSRSGHCAKFSHSVCDMSGVYSFINPLSFFSKTSSHLQVACQPGSLHCLFAQAEPRSEIKRRGNGRIYSHHSGQNPHDHEVRRVAGYGLGQTSLLILLSPTFSSFYRSQLLIYFTLPIPLPNVGVIRGCKVCH